MNVERKLLDFLTGDNLSDAEFKRLRNLMLSSRVDHFLSAAEHLRSTRQSIIHDFAPKDDASEVYQRLRKIFPNKKAFPGNNLLQALGTELEKDLGGPVPNLKLIPGLRWMLTRVDGGTVLSAAERLAERWKGKPPLDGWIFSDKKE